MMNSCLQHTSLMASRAALPCCITGTVNTGAGTASTLKLAAGASYTCSVMRSCTMAANAAFSSAVRALQESKKTCAAAEVSHAVVHHGRKRSLPLEGQHTVQQQVKNKQQEKQKQ
jgi:hypothetical protein